MNKIVKFIASGVIALIIVYFGYSFFRIYKYGHSGEFDYKRYFWLFKDSVKHDIDTIICAGSLRKKDIEYNYLYKNKYYITIWEFKELGVCELKDISFNQNVNLSNIKYFSEERFNVDLKTLPLIRLKLGFEFNNIINVNTDEYTKINKKIDTLNYKGFFGKVSRLSLSDENNKHLIILEYAGLPKTTLFLVYKANGSIYLLIVNSKIEFDEHIINIFDLK